MQSYTEITDSTTLQASLSKILENDKTAMSMSAGTAFPTTNLQQGMPCYRSDLKKLFVLTAITFSGGVAVGTTWEMLADLSAPALPQLNPNVLGTLKLGPSGKILMEEYGSGNVLLEGEYSILAARQNVYLARNCKRNAADTQWVRIDPVQPASVLELSAAGPRLFVAQTTSNPIVWAASYDLLHSGNFSAATFLPKTGGALTGPLTLAGNAASALQPVTLQQLQAATQGSAGAAVAKTGDTMSGPLTAPTIYTGNWFRSTGTSGWYSETYGGGWHMTDATHVRCFGNKIVYSGGGFHSEGPGSHLTGFRIAGGHDISTLFWQYLGQTFPQRTRTFATWSGGQVNGTWEIQPIQDGTGRAYATRPYYTNCACANCNCDCSA